MSKLDTQNIRVLNYNQNQVFAKAAHETYRFNASRDGIRPTIVTMPLSDLQYIASNSNIIVTGWLTFDEEEKEEIFKLLRIHNWKNILTIEDIEEILTNPTMDGLQKLIDIDNPAYFDRVRTVLFRLNSDGRDITTKVSRIVEQRHRELQNRQRRSSIVLSKKDTQTYATPDDVKELTAQNVALQNQLDEMKKMMEQMMAMQTAAKPEPVSESDEPVKAPAKKAGRPKKTT